MRALGNILTGVLLFLLLTPPSTADIKSIKIQSDSRPMILFEKFGFTHTGKVAVSVNSMVSQPDPSRLGFFLLSEELLIEVLQELEQNPSLCIVDSKFISLLFTFRDLSPPPHSSFSRSYPVLHPSEYSLFFASCNPQSPVTMDVRIELYNTDDGTIHNYLSAGLTHLPSLYFIFFLLYLSFLGIWISACIKNRPAVHQLHILMLALLTTKVLSFFCAALAKHHIKVTGTPDEWNVLFYTFHFTSVALSFAVIVLIGAGWPYLKPVLQAKENVVLMVVMVFQGLAAVASIVIGETGPYIQNWVIWNLVFLLADAICCCAVILPVVWSIRSFSSKTDAKNLTLFRLFCALVVAYLLVTRIGGFALSIFVSYKQQWVLKVVKETASLVFYLVIFYMFRPVEEDEYSVVDDVEGDYKEAPEMVKG